MEQGIDGGARAHERFKRISKVAAFKYGDVLFSTAEQAIEAMVRDKVDAFIGDVEPDMEAKLRDLVVSFVANHYDKLRAIIDVDPLMRKSQLRWVDHLTKMISAYGLTPSECVFGVVWVLDTAVVSIAVSDALKYDGPFDGTIVYVRHSVDSVAAALGAKGFVRDRELELKYAPAHGAA